MIQGKNKRLKFPPDIKQTQLVTVGEQQVSRNHLEQHTLAFQSITLSVFKLPAHVLGNASLASVPAGWIVCVCVCVRV